MRLGTAPDENVETMASPIRGTGAERVVEVRAWALLLSVGLPDAAVTDAKADGALHLLWFWGIVRQPDRHDHRPAGGDARQHLHPCAGVSLHPEAGEVIVKSQMFVEAMLWLAFWFCVAASWLPVPVPVADALAQAAFGFSAAAAVVAVAGKRGACAGKVE